MFLDLFTKRWCFFLLAPFFFDFFLVVSMTAFLVLCQSSQRLAIEVGLTDMFNKAGSISNQFALNSVNDWTLVLVGKPITTNDLYTL